MGIREDIERLRNRKMKQLEELAAKGVGLKNTTPQPIPSSEIPPAPEVTCIYRIKLDSPTGSTAVHLIENSSECMKCKGYNPRCSCYVLEPSESE